MNHATPEVEHSLEEIRDLSRGWTRDPALRALRCLHCATVYDAELLHQVPAGLATAERAMREHVERAHGGALAALLAWGKERTGLTDLQADLILSLGRGEGDRSVAQGLGGRSESTVRNHRFQLRRREGEAKVLVAAMALLSAREPQANRLVEYPQSLPSRDERIDVTEAEEAAILARYWSQTDRPHIARLPKKQKEKLVLLKRAAALFQVDTHYSEQSINQVLMGVHEDYVAIRRYLIEYRFLGREADGSRYWRVP